MTGPPIDVVYTWVDGERPEYQAVYRRYATTARDLNPERYRDIYTMLKYSLRSLDRYAPWVRDVYLLTCRPQVPEWLNVDHPGVHVVHHDEVIDGRYLPTFSCSVIESYLHQIPNGSEYLLYMNDDYLFGRETGREDFLTAEGRIRVYGTLFGEHFKFRVYDGRFDIVSTGLLEHVPTLIYKPFWREMLALREDELQRTRLNRFRQAGDLRVERLYRYHLLAHRRAHAAVVPALRFLAQSRFHKITNRPAGQRARLDRLRRTRPKFLCLNDDQEDRPHPEVVRLTQEFLADYFPAKSRYER